MQEIAEIITQTAGQPAPEDPVLFGLISEILLLAEELCVERDRVEIAVKLSGLETQVAKRLIEAHEFSEEEMEARLAVHGKFYEELYRRICERAGVDVGTPRG